MALHPLTVLQAHPLLQLGVVLVLSPRILITLKKFRQARVQLPLRARTELSRDHALVSAL